MWMKNVDLWPITSHRVYCFYLLTCLCNNFYSLSALVGCWSSVFETRIIYNFFLCVFLITQFLWLVGRLGSCKPVWTTPVGWLPFHQLTALSRSAIVEQSKFFCRVLCCHVAFFIFLWFKGFLSIGLSQISSFFSWCSWLYNVIRLICLLSFPFSSILSICLSLVLSIFMLIWNNWSINQREISQTWSKFSIPRLLKPSTRCDLVIPVADATS